MNESIHNSPIKHAHFHPPTLSKTDHPKPLINSSKLNFTRTILDTITKASSNNSPTVLSYTPDIKLKRKIKQITKSRNKTSLSPFTTKNKSLTIPITNKKVSTSKTDLIKDFLVKQNSVEVLPKQYLTVSRIASDPTIDNINKFFEKPIFLRTLISEGKIDQQHINLLIPLVPRDDLYEFMANMTTEHSLYSALSACDTPDKFESTISKILKFKRVLVWYKPYDANYLLSTTLTQIIPINRSIVGFCAQKRKKIITEDPAMCSGFDIDYDLTLLRGTESMALCPVINDYDDLVGVIQFIDLTNGSQPIPISKYDQSLLQLCVQIAKDKIFRDDPKAMYVPKEMIPLLQICEGSTFKTAIPSAIDQNNSENNGDHLEFINFCTIILNIVQFLKKYINCEAVDIFEYIPSSKKLLHLADGIEYSELKAGISFLPIVQEHPVFVANGLQMGYRRSVLDRKFTNNSVLTTSYKLQNIFDNDSETQTSESSIQYVFTLRAKWMLPSFLPGDLNKLNDCAPIICAAIQKAQFNKSHQTEIKQTTRNNQLIQILGKAISDYAEGKEDEWTIVRKVANDIFGAETCFVCCFDGIMMTFFPVGETCKIGECIAGKAYNLEELVEFDVVEEAKKLADMQIQKEKKMKEKYEKQINDGEIDGLFSFDVTDASELDDENEEQVEKLDLHLYDRLGIADHLTKTIAFPFHTNGSIHGSIELINPTSGKIEQFDQSIMDVICSIINPFDE